MKAPRRKRSLSRDPLVRAATNAATHHRYVRCEHVGDGRFRWTCPKGHVHTDPKNRPSLPSEALAKKMERYWNDRISYVCPRCKREELARLRAEVARG